MRTGKIARLPHDIRDQLNRRLQDGEQGKTILKWLNALPEVKAVLKQEFEGRPVAPCNLTEWKDGGFRDWLVREDALAVASNLGDETALGDKALTNGFNDKLARWVSIHYAATAKAVLVSEMNAETKFSRLRQLCADVSRLRRSDYQAERIEIERGRLTLQQSKADQLREEEFAEWLKRPEIQMKYFPKQKRGLSREALALVDNYLCQGISPLDPEEAMKLYPFGRYAVKPPIGFEMPTPDNGASNQNPAPDPDPNQVLFSFLEAADGGSPKNTSAQEKVGLAVPSEPSTAPPSNTVTRNPASRIQHPLQSTAHNPDPEPPSLQSSTCNLQPHSDHQPSTTNPQPIVEEHCLTCGDRLPALLPDGTRPSLWCACNASIAAPPGLSIRERCPYCSAPLPVHGWNTRRLYGHCTECNQNLPPLSETAPLKWLLPDSEWQQRARDLASRGIS